MTSDLRFCPARAADTGAGAAMGELRGGVGADIEYGVSPEPPNDSLFTTDGRREAKRIAFVEETTKIRLGDTLTAVSQQRTAQLANSLI